MAYTISTERSYSRKDSSASTSQWAPCLLWNPKSYYVAKDSPPEVRILNQTSPACKTTPYFFNIYFNIIFQRMPISYKQSTPYKFYN
jgi:hypothetical protein